MGSLTLGLLPNGAFAGGNSGNGARASPAAQQLTFLVPPKKADPSAAPKAEEGGEPKRFETRLAEALRDAQVSLLKVLVVRAWAGFSSAGPAGCPSVSAC